jgi:putative hydrolase of HD superfamily
MKNAISRLMSLFKFSERLKCELRHSWLSSGRQESVAEHSWQMTLMALVMHRHLEAPVDIEKVLKIIVVHDLVEAETGDVPYFESGRRQALKTEKEELAIRKIRGMLPKTTGEEVCELWYEFEADVTNEAKFANALDHLEVQLQHNFADLKTWEEIEHDLVFTKMNAFCAHDRFLKGFCDAVKKDSEKKLADGGVDIDTIKKRTGC